ncbi:tetratricopeptide repeat protein [Streptomyces sp. HNM0574]|uniref:tetratricopeptide repeat protein n=1 Tax=Streptomyces sp. HNM0574 TaxID=2714954 RepID=UPI00146E3A92|nr:tetratricopeptide repeat protein [Streptomyces sp. HNM0574]
MNGGRYDGHADGQGRVYQATGDQHIVEHHHHAESAWKGTDSVRHPAVGRAPVTLRDRTELMERLRPVLAAEQGGQVYVLHGLGGCGKTAVAYALFRHATDRGRLGLWVNASDPASLRSGMLAVAADRGAGDGELQAARSGLRAAADLVWGRLDASDAPWFLVLDNADDPSVLRDGGWLRSSPRGTVLVTSRQAGPHWWPGAELLHVGVLPREDAARVLCDLAPEAGTEEEAAAVADRLGRLPLALTLAGGFLSHQVLSPWTMSEYGRNLEGGPGDPIELLDQGAVAAAYGTDSRHLVSRTWELSLTALVDQGTPEAVTLLRLLSCWAGDPLPLTLLSGADLGPQLPAHRLDVALRGLLDQSLTTLTPGTPRSLRTHGVLLDSVARGTPDDQREQLASTAAGLLLSMLPEVPERGPYDPGLALLAPHALALLRRCAHSTAVSTTTTSRAADATHRLATALHRTGDYAAALSLGEAAADLTGARLGEEDAWTLRLRIRAARSVHRTGRFEEAERRLRALLAECERVLGPKALETLECCERLGVALHVLGDTGEVAGLIRRSAEGRAEVLGPQNPLVLYSRAVRLAVLQGADLEEEVRSAPAVLDNCTRLLGEEHPVTLTVRLNLGHALFVLDRPDEALPLALASFARFTEHFGAEYPLTIAAHSLLSRTLFAAGHTTEAIRHGEQVATSRFQALGPDHPWTANDERRLAEYREAGGE